MKRPLESSEYSFDASAKTITFSGFTPDLGKLLVIVDVTIGTVIYSVTIPAKLGSLVGQVLTLNFDTSIDCSDTDDLLIQYEFNDFVQPVSIASAPLPTGAATAANQTTGNSALASLLTELQLKADLSETQPVSVSALPLPSGASTAANQTTGNSTLSSLLTELQLKADLTETQPVSVASLPLPTGAATAANQTTGNSSLASILAELQLKADLTETQPVSVASLPLPTGAATEATLGTRLSESDFDSKVGSLTETAPGTDTASSGLNGRLQRVAQRLSSILTELQLKADLTETQPVSVAALPLPSGAATASNQTSGNSTLSSLLTELQLKADLTETQPVSIASLPLPTGAATATNQTTGNSTLASLLTELQLKADLTETQPVSVSSLPLPTGAATAANQTTGNSTLSSLLTELQLKADLTETQPVSLQAGAAGGATPYHLLCGATNNATSLKGSAGQVYSIQAANIGAAAVYLKFYNKATAPNPASDTVVKSIMIPPDKSGNNVNIPVGAFFSTGIAFAVVTDISNTGNTAVNANEVLINIDYK